MKAYPFATMITTDTKGIPIATHLPFTINDTTDKLVLTAHFSKANVQTLLIEDNTSLVIFTGPHAYISPKHYNKYDSVPTWDYIAVHAYGKATILREQQEKQRVLEDMIRFYEKDYEQQWQHISEQYKQGLMQGIVAFELEVTDLQGQQKLSQDKSAQEKNNITKELENSHLGNERDLAAYLKKTNH